MNDETPSVDEVDERTGLAVLDRAACDEVLERAPIGRIVFIDETGQPIALPVNYRWFEGAVVFRTLEGQKLAAAVLNQRVTFEVDEWDGRRRLGVSVLVKGTAHEVEDWADRERLEGIGLVPWSTEKWRPLWVRIEASEVTGRGVR